MHTIIRGDYATVIVTCNWKCSYCDDYITESVEEDNLSDQDMLDYLKEHAPARKIILTGGEPGLRSEWFWEQFFDTFKDRNIHVLTNGTFILKGFAEKYDKHIDSLLIHSVRELTDNINPKVLEYHNTYNKSEFSLVVNKLNIDLLSSFLNRYLDVEFKLFFTNSFHDYTGTKVHKYVIGREEALLIIDILKEFDNCGDASSRLMKGYLTNNFDGINGE